MNEINIRNDFPIFNKDHFIYFDNASTTQKPQVVIDSIAEFYSHYNANVHRGAYKIAEKTIQQWILGKGRYRLIKQSSCCYLFEKNEEVRP